MISLNQLPYVIENRFEEGCPEVTQSGIACWQECQQKWVLRYLLGIVPIMQAVHFVIGNAVHACFEWMLLPKNARKSEAVIQKQIRTIVNGIFDKVVEEAGLEYMVDMDKLNTGRVQACALVAAWRIVFDFDGLTVRWTEQSVRSVEGSNKHSRFEDRIAGKIDGLVADQDGNLWILEHKTKATIYNLALSGLSLNHQALFYAVLYRSYVDRQVRAKGNKEVSIKMPSGLYYNAMQKPLHKKGDNFEGRVEYMVQAMLAEPDKYFCFAPIEIPEADVVRARMDFGRLVQEMDNARPGNISRNLNSCSKFSGCCYQSLCQQGADANDLHSVFRCKSIGSFAIARVNNELEEEE